MTQRARTSSRRRVLLATAVAVAVLGGVRTASADQDEEVLAKRMRFIESGRDLLVITSVTEIFDAEAYAKLDSGLESVVVIRLAVYHEGRPEPVGYQLITRRVAYDLWDDEYVVRLDGPGGRKNLRVATRAEALKAMTEIDRLPIAALDDVVLDDHHFLATIVELNPVSSETLSEMRRWLTRRATASGSFESGSSFFGSFVSVFVNPKVEEADRIVRIRSQPFYRPRR